MRVFSIGFAFIAHSFASLSRSSSGASSSSRSSASSGWSDTEGGQFVVQQIENAKKIDDCLCETLEILRQLPIADAIRPLAALERDHRWKNLINLRSVEDISDVQIGRNFSLLSKFLTSFEEALISTSPFSGIPQGLIPDAIKLLGELRSANINLKIQFDRTRDSGRLESPINRPSLVSEKMIYYSDRKRVQ